MNGGQCSHRSASHRLHFVEYLANFDTLCTRVPRNNYHKYCCFKNCRVIVEIDCASAPCLTTTRHLAISSVDWANGWHTTSSSWIYYVCNVWAASGKCGGNFSMCVLRVFSSVSFAANCTNIQGVRVLMNDCEMPPFVFCRNPHSFVRYHFWWTNLPTKRFLW